MGWGHKLKTRDKRKNQMNVSISISLLPMLWDVSKHLPHTPDTRSHLVVISSTIYGPQAGLSFLELLLVKSFATVIRNVIVSPLFIFLSFSLSDRTFFDHFPHLSCPLQHWASYFFTGLPSVNNLSIIFSSVTHLPSHPCALFIL